MKKVDISPEYLIRIVDQNRSSTTEKTGHMICPVCNEGTLYYYFENGSMGKRLHVSCNRDNCLPLHALPLKG